MSLSTQLVRLSDIKKSNSELRLHPPAQRKKARRLIERQGIVAPIILDERFNIIDGRLRFEIAQELGWKSLDCVILHDLTDPQKKGTGAKPQSAWRRHQVGSQSAQTAPRSYLGI